jgi:hypothetical protein
MACKVLLFLTPDRCGARNYSNQSGPFLRRASQRAPDTNHTITLEQPCSTTSVNFSAHC